MPRTNATATETQAALRSLRWQRLARELTHAPASNPVQVRRIALLLARELAALGVDVDPADDLDEMPPPWQRSAP